MCRINRSFPFFFALLSSALVGAEPTSFVNSLGMVMKRVAPGEFDRGQRFEAGSCSLSEVYGDPNYLGGELDEKVHRVTLSQAFYMGATEVTNAQYEQFDPGHRSWRGREGFAGEDNEAVVFVTWDEAVAFCVWLSEKEGRHYRLPTEAEWEYACRAGTRTAYSTGRTLPEGFGHNQRDDNGRTPVPLMVAATAPNSWGFFDMHGNVEEWCQDWYGPYPAGAVTDPTGPASGTFRVTRGGSHGTALRYLRSANRLATLPEDRSWLIGFRVVAAEPVNGTVTQPQAPARWARDVSREVHPWPKRTDGDTPYFSGPLPFVVPPAAPAEVPFFFHNHCPTVTWMPNGDLLAAWFSGAREQGRELQIVASRLRRGASAWEPADDFFYAADRNMHAQALFTDDAGVVHHLNGLGTDFGWTKLAMVHRTSRDSGESWSKPRLVDPVHRDQIVHMGVVMTPENGWFLPVDLKNGTGLYRSDDRGASWRMVTTDEPGRHIRGIHAPVTALPEGSLLAVGSGSDIDGVAPASFSQDGGVTWEYFASGLPRIGGGQRAVLYSLQDGPLLYAGFTDLARYERAVPGRVRVRTMGEEGLVVQDASGQELKITGLFVALSYDGGRTWPIKKPVTAPGGPYALNGAGWTQDFVMDPTHAEPLGYLAGMQTPDGVFHLISSGLHYQFNLAWVQEPLPAEPAPVSR